MAVTRDCKRSYGQDAALLQTRVSVFWMVVLVAVVIGLPWITSGYLLTILIFCGINCIAALGLNLLTGYTGQISLGHSAFIAVGAYSYAVLAGRAGLPFYLALPLAALISAAVGLVVGLPSLRLKGFYLAIATLGFNFIAEHVLYHWTSMTRGPDGIQIPRPRECWGVLQSDRGVYYLVVGCLVLLMVYMRNLLRSKAGRAFVAIRDSDISARVIGIDLTRYKLISFMISSFYAGLAGGLLAMHLMYINPELFNIWLSVQFVGMIIVGGMGSILGSVLGAVFLTFLPEGLRVVTDLLAHFNPVFLRLFYELRVFANGLVIVLFLIFEPDGMNACWRDIKAYWKNWPFTY